MTQTFTLVFVILIISAFFPECCIQAFFTKYRTKDVPEVKIDDGLVVDYGETFTINCSIEATPQVTSVYWQRESNGLISKLEVGLAGTKGITIDNPSLTIDFASIRDSGMYSCIAYNSFGIGKSKAANITVNGGIPVIATPKTNYTVIWGNSITIVCMVTSFPKLMHVNWRRNSSGILTTLNAGAVGTNGMNTKHPSLTIDDTNLADAGTYHCSASNRAGTKRSDEIYLTVIGGIPRVTILVANYSTYYGKEVTIGCEVSATPKSNKVFWEKSVNGEKTSIDTSTLGITGSLVNSPSLTILNPTLTDSGGYTCFAKNKVGIGKSQRTRLNVYGEIPVVRIGSPVYNVIFGNSIQIHCEVIAEPEHTLVHWERKRNGLITIVNYQAIGTTGITPNTPSLTVQFATFSDRGTYTCIATNDIGIGQSHPSILLVSGDIPVVTVRSTHYFANYGDRLTLECEVTSTPEHTIVYWEKVSGEYTTNITAGYQGISGVNLENPSLTIEYITTSDTGLFRCIALNAIGIGNSKTCNVTVIADIPIVIIEQSSYTAFSGLSIDIKCTILSVPRHTYVYWRQNRNDTSTVLIPGTVGFNGMTVENPSLIITKVDVFMSGDYSCIAINEIGTGISLSTTLIVENNHDDSDLVTTQYGSILQEENTALRQKTISGILIGASVFTVIVVGSFILYKKYRPCRRQQ